MKTRRYALAFSALALAAASFAANADILFQNLGNVAPPATIGGHTLAPFDLVPQAAITEVSPVTSIPGGPGGTVVGISPASLKYTVGASWPTTWAGGYTGPAYFSGIETTTVTLTLPPNTHAFYFYTTPNRLGSSFNYNVTTNSGVSSGDVAVTTTSSGSPTIGSNGFAFYSTAGEAISTLTITANTPSGFVVGELGISTGPVAPPVTCASEGYTGTKLTWCRNICEMGYTGATLDIWIHRWINRYRDLPYCAKEGGEGEPELPQG